MFSPSDFLGVKLENKEKKKNQHYVPQYYFKFFNGRQAFISVLLVSKGKVIPSSSVADQASKSYFYGDADIENEVCIVENRLRKHIIDVLEAGSIDNRQKLSLIEYIAYQEARTSKKRAETLSAFRTIEAFIDLEDKVKDIEAAKSWHASNPVSSFSVDEAKWHWRQMLLALSSTWSMSDLSCILLENSTEIPFVFSDSPVVFLNHHMSDFSELGIVGTMSKGLVVVFPIDPRYCVLLYDSDAYRLTLAYARTFDKARKVLAISESDVQVVNTLQYLNSENCVYSADIKYLKSFLSKPRPDSGAGFDCAIDAVVDTPDKFTLKFHGAFKGGTVFPDLPFFDYKKSKRFVQARPKPLKIYEKRQKKRLGLLKDKKFLRKVAGMNFEQMMDALRV